MKKFLKIIGLLFFLVVAISIFSNTDTRTKPDNAVGTADPPAAPASSPASATPKEPEPQKKPNLEVVDHKPESGEYGTRYVTGTIKNNTNKTYSYVQVQINLYDKDGAQVGSTMDNTTNLEPGGVWKFKALILDDDATKYKIVEVTGF